jgi:hypothetical protein
MKYHTLMEKGVSYEEQVENCSSGLDWLIDGGGADFDRV